MFEFNFFAGGAKVTRPTSVITLQELVETIRSVKYAAPVKNVRKAASKKEADFFKKGLDFVTISGTFSPTRNAGNLLKHSGLIVIDFDNLVDAQALRLQFQCDGHVMACFISPSGKGLKVVVAIKDPERHKEAFADLAYYFNTSYKLNDQEKVDPSGSDVSRACFLSWDPDAYYNPNAKIYAIRNEIPQKPRTEKQLSQDATELEKYVAVLVDRIETHSMDICDNYGDEWLMIAFCLSVLGENGRQYFHRISKQNAKYDERDTDAKFDNALKTCRFTHIAKLLNICRDYGIDVSRPKPEKPVKVKSENVSNEYDDLLADAATLIVKNQTPSPASIQKGLKIGYNRAWRIIDQLEHIGVIGASDGSSPRMILKDQAGLDQLFQEGTLPELKQSESQDSKPEKGKKKKKRQDDDLDDDESNDYFTVWYTASGGMKIKAGKYFDDVADNFQLFIKYRTEDEQENVTWVLEIKKASGEVIFLEVLHEDFCSAKKLKTMLATKRLGFKIKDGHLDELQSYLFNRTEFSTASKVIRYGFHPESKMYFFANKALNLKTGELLQPDKFGIVQANNMHLSIPQKKKAVQLRYSLTETDTTFQKFWNLYANAHLYDNAFIPTCFYIFSLFRDMGIALKNFSPILFLKGGAGTGKSSMARTLTAAFGRKQEGVNLKTKNTDSGLIKLMSQTSNIITWFDEFHNDMGGTTEGLLQAAYDNDGYHKSSSDFNSIDTDSVDLYSALALTSNFIPQNPIFFTRCVFIPITAQKKTDEQRRAFYQLEEMQEAGLGSMTIELLRYRELLEANNNYEISYNRIYNGLKMRFNGQDIGERMFANMAQLMAAPFTFHCFGRINMLTYETNIEAEILKEFLDMGETYILRQWRIMKESKASAVFFENIQTLFDNNRVHPEFHFRFVGENIRLNFRKLYNLFAERFKMMNNRETPPDRDTIQSEIATLAGYDDWESISKNIRFANDGMGHHNATTIPFTGSCELPYKLLQQNFGIDFQNRQSMI